MHRGLLRFVVPVLALVPSLVSGLVSQHTSLTRLVAESERSGFRTGVAVLDLGTGRFTFRHRSNETFVPASNQKIFTVAAALWGLGADFRFRTIFKLRDGFLEVHPGGDPNWITGSAHDPSRVFAKLAQELRQRGVTRLRGVRRLQGFFKGPDRPEGWPADQFDRLYCAPTGGLILDSASFAARISAPAKGAASKQARIELLRPPAAVRFRTGIRMTSKRKKRYSYWISQGSGTFRGHGEFSTRAGPVTVRGVVQQPGWMFERSLRTVLGKHGIQIGDAAITQPALAKSAPANRQLVEVYIHTSSLRECLGPILRDSSNFHAEQLLRVLGTRRRGDGSFLGGAVAVRAQLGSRVELPANLKIVDGSGLSRHNRLTPRCLVQVMQKLCTGPHASLFEASLARGGVDGTLRRRFGKLPTVGRAVRAKTGTINGVKSLSGIVRTASGQVRLFSILMNRRKGTSTRGASALQERMVQAIHRGR